MSYRKVLIITYYWPPSGGSGVQRWLKMSKYLPEFGWEPVIFTPENPDFDLKDESLLKEVNPHMEVIKYPIWEPYQLFRKLKGDKKADQKVLENKQLGLLDQLALWLRGNLLIPDPRRFWVKPASQFLQDILVSNEIDIIITTGPPHSMHLIGASLHQKSGIPWIADFRDPWTDWDFLDTLKLSRWARAKHDKLEQKVLQSASHILTISPTFAEQLRVKGGKAAISVLTNGYDTADVPVLPEIDPATSQLNIVYAGVIDAIRDPRPLFKACKSLPEELQSKWQIDFVGKVSEKIKEEVGNDPQLKDHVFFRGYVSHQEVFDYYEKADLLLLVLTNTKNAKGNIPGKIFEYAASGRFILALGDPEGDAAQIIHQYRIGKVFAHDQIEALRDFLLTVINDKSSLRVKSDQVMAYERKNLTHQLAKILDQYVKDPLS
ncbi:glycosyltransferase family 4 protein [Penaeicola halotolerans]|uniref:glycosyltransferase family 4 protein n=1 Tax=Penaeicola halotolerans TaxID=2793196 RepID=UPI001CF80B50|nr:glycosyltransferase family 4 protein [Penaeicola halotolerans]